MKIKKLQFLMIFVMAALPGFSQSSGFYDFKVKTLEGNEFNFSSLKGKKVMIVNTASRCGFTPQYEDLELLYEQYKQKLVIIGFPANNFANQEPGSAMEIRQFCTEKFGVTFPMMEKISVKGNDMHPLYKWLTSKDKNGVMDSEVKWNFQKYLIDENGKVVDVVYTKEKPGSDKVLTWLSAK
ncbi:MAG: glutathione peroxidase [Bacteroidales bacterium]|jgi:glutathione peroxidase|nr:glutathione peroxidase [Bacteroidales bacterium]